MPVTSAQDSFVRAVGDRRGVAAADRLCAACVDLFEVDAAAISLVFDGSNTGTLGASDAQARSYDELQFTLGEGPCLESVSIRAPVLVIDLADPDRPEETRWPIYGPAMLARGVHGVFAVPVLVAGEYIGALDLFRSRPGALGSDELAGALIAAELAELPLLDLLGGDLQAAIADPDSFAWTELNSITRSEVAQATGMLVGQLEIEPADALVRLRAYAYSVGRSATDVARDILEHRLVFDDDR